MDIIWLIDRTLAWLESHQKLAQATHAELKAANGHPAFIEATYAEERNLSALIAHWRDARGFISDAIDDDAEEHQTKH